MIDRAYLEGLFGVHEIRQLSGGDDTDAAANARLAEAIERAEEEVNSRLAPRYAIPIVNATEELRERTADIARARLYVTARPEYIDDRATEAREYLDQAAQAKREIIGLAPRQTNAASGLGLRTRADRLFTRETLTGY